MRKLYRHAVSFLLKRIPHPSPQLVLNDYLGKTDESAGTTSLSDLFRRILSSAQNANMKAGVIGGSIGGFTNLGIALFKFNPARVNRKFSGDPISLLEHIRTTLQPRGQIRTTNKSIWPKYCKTILSTATFLSQFKDGDDFCAWANHLYLDERTMAALPLIISSEIEGIGYALACDFLKELGYTNYGKPDVHVKQIFAGLGLCQSNATPYQIQKIISMIANAAGVPSYDVDKVFWLIGSGKFYKHPQMGKKGYIGRMKKSFVEDYGAV